MAGRIWYFPIESYKERYTAQLVNWTTSAFDRWQLPYEIVGPSRDQVETTNINNAGPLDVSRRPRFSALQCASFFDVAGDVRQGDVIYFDDMFTPGFEAIPYYLDQVGLGGKVGIYTRNHAGSCDIYDYVYKSKRWMRHYETMVARACETVFCASTIHKELMDVQGIDNVQVVGLPFDKDEVTKYHPYVPYAKRDKRILFSSRVDKEKDPLFFLQLARTAKSLYGTKYYEFAFATGKNKLMSNDSRITEEILRAASDGVVTLYEGLSKSDYYRLVATSEVQFNCALQDFVSYTMLEASAYGTPTVAPSFRSFPEALFGNSDCLYPPGCIDSALAAVCNVTPDDYDVFAPAKFHHSTLDKICSVFKNFQTSAATLAL